MLMMVGPLYQLPKCKSSKILIVGADRDKVFRISDHVYPFHEALISAGWESDIIIAKGYGYAFDVYSFERDDVDIKYLSRIDQWCQEKLR